MGNQIRFDLDSSCFEIFATVSLCYITALVQVIIAVASQLNQLSEIIMFLQPYPKKSKPSLNRASMFYGQLEGRRYRIRFPCCKRDKPK